MGSRLRYARLGPPLQRLATPEDVGYKAVAVNASDVASMGEPRGSSWHRQERPTQRPRSAARGILEACERFGIYPLG